MPALNLAVQAYDRPSYSLPEARLVNMLVEPGDTSDTGKVWFQRGGLSSGTGSYTVGTGPIRGLLQPSPVAFTGVFTVSGGQLYRGATLIGAAPNTLFPTLSARMACSDTQLVVVTDLAAYCDDAGVYGPITDPDLPANVIDVVILAGRFIYICPGQAFYWSDIGDATSIDGLAFASVESDPDALQGAIVVNDSIYFLGAKTIERWVPSSDPDAPYQRIVSGGYSRGCATITATVTFDNTFVWIGEDRIVYRAGNIPERISNTSIEEKLRAVADMSLITAYRLVQDGHVLYVLNIPDQETVVYDALSKTWSTWESYGRTTFRGRCADAFNDIFFGGLNGAKFLVGDDETGQVWLMDPDQSFDETTTAMTRVVSGVLKLPAGVQPLKNIMLQCVRGVGNFTDPGLDPQVEMRLSKDGGRTWGEWAARSLGKLGEYGKKAIWRGLGQVRSPGLGVEFRCTDSVKFTVEGAVINESTP